MMVVRLVATILQDDLLAVALPGGIPGRADSRLGAFELQHLLFPDCGRRRSLFL